MLGSGGLRHPILPTNLSVGEGSVGARSRSSSFQCIDSVDFALETLFDANEERLSAAVPDNECCNNSSSDEGNATGALPSNPPPSLVPNTPPEDQKVRDDIICLLGEHMPLHSDSPGAAYSQGFVALRLLLLRYPNINTRDQSHAQMMADSYRSYLSSAREPKDIAVLLARDYLFLLQQHQQSHTMG
jgi:hypothetical protein